MPIPDSAKRVLGEMTETEVTVFQNSYDGNRGNDESWRIGYAIEAVKDFRRSDS